MSTAKYQQAGSHSDSEGEEDDLKSRHGCTDVPCCLIFVAAIVATVVLCKQAQGQGGIGRLYAGIEADGSICGVSDGVQDEKLLAWCFGPGSDGGTPTTSSFRVVTSMCVAQCPSEAAGVGPVTCPSGSYSAKNSRPILGRYCIPDAVFKEGMKDIWKSQFESSSAQAALSLSSISAGWPLLVGTFCMSVVLGFLYLGFLRCCAEIMIWLCIVGSFLGLSAASFYLWENASTLGTTLSGDMQLSEGDLENQETAARIAAAVCGALAVSVVFLACCLGGSIRRAVACVQAACSAIFEMPTLLLAPAVKAIAQGILAIVLLYGFMLVYSMGDVTAGTKAGVGRHVEHTSNEWYAIWWFVFMSFWIIAFASALYQFTMAFAFAKYYYSPYDDHEEKHVNGCCAGIEGFMVGAWYHSGSLAFGSLLVAILHTIQKLVEYAQQKNKDTVDNKLVSCILCCVNCCVGCCAEAVEFVNKNAYIDMAVNSHGFCASAREAFHIIVEQGGSMAILNGATYIFTVFGTLFITLLSGVVLFFASEHGPFADEGSESHVVDPLAVAIAGMIIAFCVALSFMHVFDMASDTLLYCYASDKLKHQDQPSRAGCAAFEKLMHDNDHDDHS